MSATNPARSAVAGLAAVVAALAVAAPAEAASEDVVISQLYGGGGNAGATLRNDYIELFNRSTEPVSVDGWSVQYASAGGTSWQHTALSGTIAPRGYYLVREAAGAGGTEDLPAPDAAGGIAMSATAGKVALATSTAALGCGATAGSCSGVPTVRDLVGYGSASDFEAAPAPGLSNLTAATRRQGGCQETDDNAADFAAAAPQPRNSASPASQCLPDPDPLELRIHEIQGPGHLSPYEDTLVAGVEGVVAARSANGFWIQDPAPDDDPATSEGIFVFTSSAPPAAAAVGALVEVAGRVQEFRPGCFPSCAPSASGFDNLTTTEIVSPTVSAIGSGTIPPTVIGPGGRMPPTMAIDDDSQGSVEAESSFDPDSDGIDFHESLEGMLVRIDDAVAVGPTNAFGEIAVLAADGAGAGLRTPRGGIVIRPDDFNPERLIIDDLLAPTPAVDVGDRLAGSFEAVVDYSFGNFKYLPLATPEVIDGGLLPERADAPRSNQLAAASLNVENLDPGDPPAKFTRLAAQVVDSLRAPDLIAVEEIQDNSGPVADPSTDASETWALLIEAIVAAGGPRYDYRQIDPEAGADGGEPGGNIRVGFLFRTDRGLEFVDRPGGDAATATHEDASAPGAQLTLSPGRIEPTDPAFANSRKPLAGEFKWKGRTLFAVANHFNSKGGDDPLFGRFQPPVRGTEAQRHRQAELVGSFVDELLAADERARVIVLGDLNDFQFSETLAILADSGLHNLVETLPAAERYSYVFDGNSQVLDQILVTDALLRPKPEYESVHVNSEFADQVSDHDPQLARIVVNGPR